MALIQDFLADRAPPDMYEAYLSPGLFFPWAEALVEATQPAGKGLDIACGTGVVSRTLAKQAKVTSISAIDVAPPMIDKARAIAAVAKHELPIEFHTASARDLPFDDNSFDFAICQQGLQFFPDKEAALREALRVLKPGGQFAAAVWTAANDGNPVFAAFEDIVAKHLGDDLLPFGPFSFGDGEQLMLTAQSAGMVDANVTRHEMETTLPDVRSLVLFDLVFLGRPADDGSLQPVIAIDDDSADEIIETMIAELDQAVARFKQPNGSLISTSTVHFLTGTAA